MPPLLCAGRTWCPRASPSWSSATAGRAAPPPPVSRVSDRDRQHDGELVPAGPTSSYDTHRATLIRAGRDRYPPCWRRQPLRLPELPWSARSTQGTPELGPRTVTQG